VEELLGTLVTLIAWVLWAVQQARKGRARSSPGASTPPPLPADPAERRHLLVERAARRAEQAIEDLRLARDGAPALLQEPVESTLAEAREVHRGLSDLRDGRGEEPLDAEALSDRAESLQRAARQLRRLRDRHADPVRGPVLAGAALAVAECVPELPGSPVVQLGAEEHDAAFVLADFGVVPLSLPEDAATAPWQLAALVEEAWAAALLRDPHLRSEVDALVARGLGERTDALERFAGALAVAWAPALLLDAACALQLAGGHLARVRRTLVGSAHGFVLRLDAERRVDSVPPPGVRVQLLAQLLERLEVPDAAALAGPPPPEPVLHLRGPGVWDQVPLAPVLAVVGEAQHRLAVERLEHLDGSALAEHPELQDAAVADREALRAVEESAAGALSARPRGRTLLAALARLAGRSDGRAIAGPLLEALADRSREAAGAAEARPARAPGGGPRRATPPSLTPGPRGRASAVAQAILLGEALGARRG
jgi:hypothetical protein